jgi:peptidoglycan lytic transglycosylase
MVSKIWTAAGLALVYGLTSGAAYAHGAKKTSGVAAYYSKDYKGPTASGARYDPNKFTAAHRTLPFGTRVRVTNPRSGRSVVVVVNDRGPFNKGRMIDLSLAAAKELRMLGRGLMRVTAEIEPPATFTTASETPKR